MSSHLLLSRQFTLYFHGTLSEHSIVYNMKHLSAKIDRDYIGSMLALFRHIPSVAISLVFDSNGLPEFRGPKYSFPGSPAPVLTGLNSYPFMITIPQVTIVIQSVLETAFRSTLRPNALYYVIIADGENSHILPLKGVCQYIMAKFRTATKDRRPSARMLFW